MTNNERIQILKQNIQHIQQQIVKYANAQDTKRFYLAIDYVNQLKEEVKQLGGVI